MRERVSFAVLTGCDVTDFLRWEIKRRRLHHADSLLAGMRAFLRFLHYRGLLKTDLSPVVPRTAKWSLAGLTKHFPPGAADKVLAECDRSQPRGRRDYAMLLLPARLGLRASEVLRLRLDDIDWEHGQILVRSKKGPGHARMPLPEDAGRALAAYLRRDRPACASRHVFVRAIAPHRPLSTKGAVLSVLVARYMVRAGIRSVRTGVHAFRHGSESVAGTRDAVAGRCSVKTFTQAADDYLELQRAVGFRLDRHEIHLREFVSFLRQQRATRITTRLALAFATGHAGQGRKTQAGRLSVARGFARYVLGLDSCTEVPPIGLLPARSARAKPYLYTLREIRHLLKAARDYETIYHPLRAWNLDCMLGLLAVTGMRVSEVANLGPEDIDWKQGVLTVRKTKFGKTRLVPLHASTMKVLAQLDRDKWIGRRDHTLLLLAAQTGLRLSGSPGSNRRMSRSGPARTSAAKAKAGRNARRRLRIAPRRL